MSMCLVDVRLVRYWPDRADAGPDRGAHGDLRTLE